MSQVALISTQSGNVLRIAVTDGNHFHVSTNSVFQYRGGEYRVSFHFNRDANGYFRINKEVNHYDAVDRPFRYPKPWPAVTSAARKAITDEIEERVQAWVSTEAARSLFIEAEIEDAEARVLSARKATQEAEEALKTAVLTQRTAEQRLFTARAAKPWPNHAHAAV